MVMMTIMMLDVFREKEVVHERKDVVRCVLEDLRCLKLKNANLIVWHWFQRRDHTQQKLVLRVQLDAFLYCA